MVAFQMLMFPIYLIVWFGNFVERLHKKIEPDYVTYSEYLSSMEHCERAEYAQQRRIERRAVYDYRRRHRGI